MTNSSKSVSVLATLEAKWLFSGRPLCFLYRIAAEVLSESKEFPGTKAAFSHFNLVYADAGAALRPCSHLASLSFGEPDAIEQCNRLRKVLYGLNDAATRVFDEAGNGMVNHTGRLANFTTVCGAGCSFRVRRSLSKS